MWEENVAMRKDIEFKTEDGIKLRGWHTTDPLVNPGNPPHCYQTCSKADSTRTYHRVVFLAQSSPGCRSTRPLQIKKATVMLSTILAYAAGYVSTYIRHGEVEIDGSSTVLQ